MKKIEQLSKSLNSRMRQAAAVTFDAFVLEVDEPQRTCKVETTKGITYENVALFAVKDKLLKGVCLVPKIHSKVLVSRIGGSNMLYVASYSAIDRVIMSINDQQRDEDYNIAKPEKNICTFEMSVNGFKMFRNTAGLKKTLSDLCDAIMWLTVTTNTGQSGTPINATKFAEIKNELNQYLNDN
jgi:hypothetical protein